MKNTFVPRFSLFRKFAGSPPSVKIRHLDPSTYRRIRIIRLLEQVSEGTHKSNSHYRVSAKKERKKKEKKKALRIPKHCFGGGRQFSQISAFRGGTWDPIPAKSEGKI